MAFMKYRIEAKIDLNRLFNKYWLKRFVTYCVCLSVTAFENLTKSLILQHFSVFYIFSRFFHHFLAQKLKYETILKHCMFEISVLQKVMNVKNAVGVGKIVNEPPP